MSLIRKTLILLAAFAVFGPSAHAKTIVDFETLGATLANDSAYVGQDGAGGFAEKGVQFNNSYGTFPGGDFWSGNAYSNRTSFNPNNPYANRNDTVSVPGTGVDGSSTWGVIFSDSAIITAPNGAFFDSLYVTNTRTAQQLIVNGSQFSDPFGGDSGNDEDLFTIQFHDLSGNAGFVEVVLADYRFSDNTQDYVLDEWQLVDLSSLNQSSQIGVRFTSTDTGQFGINTPTYAAIDNIAYSVPEPGMFVALAAMGGVCFWFRGRRRAATAKS